MKKNYFYLSFFNKIPNFEIVSAYAISKLKLKDFGIHYREQKHHRPLSHVTIKKYLKQMPNSFQVSKRYFIIYKGNIPTKFHQHIVYLTKKNTKRLVQMLLALNKLKNFEGLPIEQNILTIIDKKSFKLLKKNGFLVDLVETHFFKKKTLLYQYTIVPSPLYPFFYKIHN